MKYLITISMLAVYLILTAFQAAYAHSPQELGLHGDLRLIAKNGLTEIKPLEAYQLDENFYGIGMPEGLDQEVIVLGGKVYTAEFKDFNYHTATVSDLNLVFFASAHVPEWQDIKIPSEIKTFGEFQDYLAKVALKHGFDTKKGFMFRLEAEMDNLKWFIVGGTGNLKPNPLKSFLRQRYLGGIENRTIEALGTYSEDLQGIASVPTSPMHMHFITIDDDKLFIGHIDNDFQIGDNATLYLPALERKIP